MGNIPSERSEYRLPDNLHSGLTVRGLMELWLLSIQSHTNPILYQNYKSVIECQIIPVLGDCEVDYLTDADIEDFLNEKRRNGRVDGRGGLSKKTVDNIAWMLRSALKLVEWEGQRRFVKSPHRAHSLETLSAKQTETLVKYLTEHPDRTNVGFLLCLFTGIKLSELCSLMDSDIDLERDILYIRRTLRRVTQGDEKSRSLTEEYTPEDRCFRDLALPEALSMLLWSAIRRGEEGAYFLTGKAGVPLGMRAYQYRFQRMLADVGLPENVNCHMFRNTFALMWMLRRDDLPGLSRALGHGSIQVTRDRYAGILDCAENARLSCLRYLCANMK